MSSITTRIKRDFENMKSEYMKGDVSCPFELLEDSWKSAVRDGGSLSNPRNFNLLIKGPSESYYENGLFEVNIRLEDGYPMKPPKITFVSESYHPNIRGSSICLSTLKDNSWSPALMLYKVIMSLQALLADPYPDDPLNPDVAHDLKSNKEHFIRMARETTASATEKVQAKRAALKSK